MGHVTASIHGGVRKDARGVCGPAGTRWLVGTGRRPAGTTGDCISDGGNDMYDCGNQMNLEGTSGDSKQRLLYTQATTATRAGIADISYLTLKTHNVWLAAFESASGSIARYFTSGNNGADGRGAQELGQLGESSRAPGYYGWYKQVYGANDPSINELIITTDAAWIHSMGGSTDSGHHELRSSTGTGVSRIYYLMWAGASGHQYGREDFLLVMETFLEHAGVADYADGAGQAPMR
ncbi:hypothetical protein CYMTET_3486 [Cymbomonas tetramitiformis]|uniref:Uncharacterized protein n=1 Tax=Cymbomonas tetramitiformis TaxID=36881 RepID=A0AAE0H3L5_9CHLO|nr:hypothetical protein CYMTET_3486 [Cymbomonas tetramitiformis]